MTPEELEAECWAMATVQQRAFALALAKQIETYAGRGVSMTFIHHALRFASEYVEGAARAEILPEAIAQAVVKRQFDKIITPRRDVRPNRENR